MIFHVRPHECAESLLRLTAPLKSNFKRSWPHASCLRKRHQFARLSSPFMSHTNCDINTFKKIMIVRCARNGHLLIARDGSR